jgi:hypothetical protein
MDKNWKKEFLQNLGAIILSGFFAFVGYYLTKDLKLQPTPEGHAIEFGGNALLMIVAPSIPGLLLIFYTYREIRLLVRLFLNGGPKTRISCMVIIGFIIVLCVGLSIATFSSTKQSSVTAVNKRQVFVEEFIQAANENDIEKMDSFLWIPLGTMDSIEQESFTNYCATPTYIGEDFRSTMVLIHMKCGNETGERIYTLIQDSNNDYKISEVTR